MQPEKLMLIDGNSILSRAFYGLQGDQLLATSDGLYTNGIFGFINILNKYSEEEKPDYICVAFDMRAPTFRHIEFENYKAKRKGMPSELAVQLPVMKEVLDAMNIRRIEYEGYEADDIIGSISLCAEKAGLSTVIVTGDRDSLQLISDKVRVKLPVTRGGRTETEEYDYARVIEKYGVTPFEFIDVKALMGDPSDNIPGVPGVGEKTALTLINRYKSIEKLYEELETVERKNLRDKLEGGRELAFLSKKLATIERNMPELCSIEELKLQPPDNEKLYDIFQRLEFKILIERYGLEPSAHSKQKVLEVETVVLENLDQVEELALKLKRCSGFSINYMMDRPEQFVAILAGLGFSMGDGKAYYVPAGKSISPEDILGTLKDVLEDESVSKYGHNLKDFIYFLKLRGIKLKGISFDTMIAAYILNPSRDSYTVDELASDLLKAGVGATIGLTGKGKGQLYFYELPVDEVSTLCCLHSEAIYRLKGVLEKRLTENGQDDLYKTIELPLVEVLADMEYYGFKVNTDELKVFQKELEEKIELLADEIYALAGENFNINSTKQLGVILFEKLGLPVIKKTKTGYSTNAEVLDELSSKHEIVLKILEYRQLVKLKSTYAEGLLNVIDPRDSRIHSSFNQTVTATGRISSTEPNLQNIPIKLEMGRKIRKVFIPEEGYTLLDADYSQIELRVLAHITGDENMISAFTENEDIHTSTAAKVFKVSKAEVTQIMRGRAKAINFGIVYGIGDFSLSKDLGITRKQARQYIEDYLDKYPGVRKYMNDIVEQGREMGFVTTLFNRRRYLPELKSSNFNLRSFGERVAMNTPIQGSAADIIKIAMVKVFGALKERGLKSRLILQVHDELIIETHKEEMAEVEKIMTDSMEHAVKLAVPLTIDINFGNNWYETK